MNSDQTLTQRVLKVIDECIEGASAPPEAGPLAGQVTEWSRGMLEGVRLVGTCIHAALQCHASEAPQQPAGAVVYPPDGTASPFTVINLGTGRVQMGDAIHDRRLPALWFGTGGKGMGHEQALHREAHDGETLAVVTFANVEGLDVLLDVVQRIRRVSFPDAPATAAAPAEWREFVAEVAAQKPEKPDHWSTCGQCERNISRAEDLIAAPHPAGAPMADRPILFSAPMVRAILAGTKTQTRRMVKDTGLYAIDAAIHGAETAARELQALASRCPYGQPGHTLWVREAWARTTVGLGTEMVVYREGDNRTDYGGPWKPGIHMPRAASRITLAVIGIRIERLQAISRGDAMAEGCPFANMAAGPDPRDWYRDLWDQINGPGAWDANPWVWVVEFKRVKP